MTIQTRLRAALTVLALLFTFASAALLPTAAHAVTKVTFKASAAQVKAACGASGGIEGGYTEGRYGCTKLNCDGKGGACSVDCTSDGKCTGISPRRAMRPGRSFGGFFGGLIKITPSQPPQSIVDGADSNGTAATPSAPAPSAPTGPIFN